MTEAGGDHLDFLHEFQRERMCAEKLFDRPWVRLAGIGRDDGSLESEKILAVTDDEAILR